MTAPIEFYTPWRKSSFSADTINCVEVAFGTWRKSSFSAHDSNCVEIAVGGEVAGVRDSKSPGAGHLALDPAAYQALLGFANRR